MTPSGQPSKDRRSPRATRRRAKPELLPGDPQKRDAAILAQRAAELARPRPQPTALPTNDATVVVRVGGQRLGFPSRYVQEAVGLTEITPLPGLPVQVLGLANVRSRVLPVFTLAPVFRLAHPAEPTAKLLLLRTERGEFAVPIDELEGIRAIELPALQRTISGATETLVHGVAADGLLLVDVPALAAAFALSDEGSSSRSLPSP